MKPFIGAQPVKVRSGQSRSGQAGSECCISRGDPWDRSVHSEEAGREDSAPKSSSIAEADVVNLAEGRTVTTQHSEVAAGRRSLQPGARFQGGTP